MHAVTECKRIRSTALPFLALRNTRMWVVISSFGHFKVKVKCTLLQALRLYTGRTAYRGSRGIAILFLDHGTVRVEGSFSRPGRSLPPGKTRYPLYRRLCGPQGRSGQVQKISSPPGFDPRTVQTVASRYKLPGSLLATLTPLNYITSWIGSWVGHAIALDASEKK